MRRLFHCYNKRKSQERLMPSAWCHRIKMFFKCLHSRSTSYTQPALSKVGVSVKNLLVMAEEAVALEINTCDMLTSKEPYKPISFQTKFDFTAWLQEEHISEVLPSKATHTSALVSGVLSQYCSVSKWEAKPSSLLSLGKCLTLRALQGFSLKWQNVFLSSPHFLSSSKTQEKRKHFKPLLTNNWDGDIHLSHPCLHHYDYIKEVTSENIFKPNCLIYNMQSIIQLPTLI